MNAYDASPSSDLFVASAGAAAALAGLVYVAVSINIEQILQYEGLPERALETLLLLMGAVVASLVGLAPGQNTTALGIELAGIGVVGVTATGLLVPRAPPPGGAATLADLPSRGRAGGHGPLRRGRAESDRGAPAAGSTGPWAA